MASGGGGTTQTSGPSGFIQPYLESALDAGQNLYENNPLYRPALNTTQRQGLDAYYNTGDLNQQRLFGAETLDRGQQFASNVLSGYGFGNAGRTQLQDTARGDYLYGGPGYEAAEEAIRRRLPGVMDDWGLAGRSGSGLAATAASREITDAYRLANEAERGRQVSAAGTLGDQHLRGMNLQSGLAGMSPALMNADYTAGRNLLSTGNFLETHERGRREEPWDRYSQWMGSYGPLLSQGGTQTTTSRDMDPVSSIAGLGMTAAGLGWNPFGTAATTSVPGSNLPFF